VYLVSEHKKISSGSKGDQEGIGAGSDIEADLVNLDKQDEGAELGGAQVTTVPDPTGGVKVKKVSLPKR
jgi:hypothetical protein